MMNLNLISLYALENLFFIHTGIVDYESDITLDNETDDDFDDTYADLNIYEKIQMLKLESLYDNIDKRLLISPDTTIVKNSIPIPKFKKYLF
jgi:hypothetical protein